MENWETNGCLFILCFKTCLGFASNLLSGWMTSKSTWVDIYATVKTNGGIVKSSFVSLLSTYAFSLEQIASVSMVTVNPAD